MDQHTTKMTEAPIKSKNFKRNEKSDHDRMLNILFLADFLYWKLNLLEHPVYTSTFLGMTMVLLLMDLMDLIRQQTVPTHMAIGMIMKITWKWMKIMMYVFMIVLYVH